MPDELASALSTQIATLVTRLDGYVQLQEAQRDHDRRRIELLERIVFGAVGLIAVGVLGALVALVVAVNPPPG